MKHLKALNQLTHYVLEKANLSGCVEVLHTTVGASILAPAQILALLKLSAFSSQQSAREASRIRCDQAMAILELLYPKGMEQAASPPWRAFTGLKF